MQEGNFPELLTKIKKLSGRLGGELPEAMGGFARLHRAAVADGALSTKTKELMALAIGIACRCDGCIAYHIHDALDAGASSQEVEEAIGVAILMGGGPAMIYGCDALVALDEFNGDVRAS